MRVYIKYSACFFMMLVLAAAKCSKDEVEKKELIKFNITPKLPIKKITIPKGDKPTELSLHEVFNNTRTQGLSLDFSLGSDFAGLSILRDSVLAVTKAAKKGLLTVLVTQKKTDTHQAGSAKATVQLITAEQLQTSPVSFNSSQKDAYYLVAGDRATSQRQLSAYVENTQSVNMEYVLDSVAPSSSGVKLTNGVLSITDKVSAGTMITVRFSHIATAQYKAFSETKVFVVNIPTIQKATYKISFKGHWTKVSHGVYPISAHFTTPVGLQHAQGAALFNSGEKATKGLEYVAEAGVTSTMLSEIKQNFEDQNKGSLISFSISGSGEATGSTSVEVKKETPLLSLVSMIAPTSDWFISFKGSFLNDGGTWKDRFTIEAIAYDAGTEDGDRLTLDNPDTNPKENISRLNITTPFNIKNGKVQPNIATLTIEKL